MILTPPEAALHILHRLRTHARESYLCGGCVRDAIMGIPPKDYDIATAATPDEVEQWFPKTIPIGKSFGVMLVEGEDGQHYEVATFRKETGYTDARRPDEVTFSDAEEDARRRDFTINALFYDPFEDKVIDYTGGQEDIRNKRLRTVGKATERFAEDHLRLLRAIRFAARTGFEIEENTWRAIQALAHTVTTVSPERIATETELMLTGGFSAPAMRLYEESGLLAHTLPEAAKMKGVPQPPDYHPEGDVWTHTLLLLALHDTLTPPPSAENTPPVDARRGMERGDFTTEEYIQAAAETRAAIPPEDATTLAWSLLLHDIGKPDTIEHADRIRFNNHDLLGAELSTAILIRLRRPRKVIDGVYDLIRRHIHVSTLRKMRKSKLRRWLRGAEFPMHLELHRLDCASSHGMLANWWFGVNKWREERALPRELPPLLRGGDVIALGVPPGREIGRLLTLVEDARLEGELTTKEEALRFLETELQNKNT